MVPLDRGEYESDMVHILSRIIEQGINKDGRREVLKIMTERLSLKPWQYIFLSVESISEDCKSLSLRGRFMKETVVYVSNCQIDTFLNAIQLCCFTAYQVTIDCSSDIDMEKQKQWKSQLQAPLKAPRSLEHCCIDTIRSSLKAYDSLQSNLSCVPRQLIKSITREDIAEEIISAFEKEVSQA